MRSSITLQQIVWFHENKEFLCNMSGLAYIFIIRGSVSLSLILTLFLSGRGHYGPSHHEQSRCFCRVRATTTKIHDFVSVYVWMVPWKSFLGFVFKIFEKRKKFFLTISTSKGPPFGKKIENIKKNFFLEKIILFLFEFVLYMF